MCHVRIVALIREMAMKIVMAALVERYTVVSLFN